jgi:SAM-dependent methyltransferase
MDELSKEYIIDFFDKNLLLHGDRPEAVRWTLSGQLMHYQAMLDIGDISNSKILDFGCGKGDFYQFLLERKIPVQYHGFDINKNLIEIAKRKFPDVDFRVFDIDVEELKEDFDYIFLCGVFNLKVEGIDQMIKNTLVRLFSHCRIALAFNALSTYEPKKDFELNYLSPEDLFSFVIKNLSPYISLRHDRIKYDFTLFIYKNQNLHFGPKIDIK